mmetsp:Transcript_90648/g.265306  ORF Transcript_90648/g.265306 Transcript_90648/m.265306 type:complete len:93 (-) Transcript_90648:282-560(-)
MGKSTATATDMTIAMAVVTAIVASPTDSVAMTLLGTSNKAAPVVRGMLATTTMGTRKCAAAPELHDFKGKQHEDAHGHEGKAHGRALAGDIL